MMPFLRYLLIFAKLTNMNYCYMMIKKFLFAVFFLIGMGVSVEAQERDLYSGHVVADEGAWCWFADPRALHYENEAGTINATYIG